MPETTPAFTSLWDGPKTVADFIALLSSFPPEWRVSVSTSAGGGIAVEHREIKGEPIVGIFGKNGGRFGENPLTEDEYHRVASNFLAALHAGQKYTSIHGDHRLYRPIGMNDTCYGTHYDRRVIERMVSEGLIAKDSVDLERIAAFDR